MATAASTRRKSTRRSPNAARSSSTRRRRVSGGLGETVKGAMAAVGRLLTGGVEAEYDSLHDLFVKELNDLYSAENQLLEALPKMAESASSKALATAFRNHLQETRGQVTRLKQVFKELKLDPNGHKCKAMEGLIKEGSEWMGENATAGVEDAGLIAAAQRVEHYEIAGYGCVRTYARLLGHRRAAELLQATLDEEAEADKKLTALSKRINVQAQPERRCQASPKRRAK